MPELSKAEQRAVLVEKMSRMESKTPQWMRGLLDTLAASFGKHMVGPLVSRIKNLETEVAELREQQKAARYRGTWQRADQYEKGNFITHDGSLWVALKPTVTQPGTSEDWQLCARKGRDAR